MNKIQKLLNKPYPLIDHWMFKTFMVLGVGVFVYLFITVYHPFGTQEIVTANPKFILGYSFFVSFCLSISYFIYPAIFPKWFLPDNWIVKKEIIFLIITYLQVTVVNYIYHDNFVANHIAQFSVIKFISITFFIGILPVIFMIFFLEYYLNKKNQSIAKNIKPDTVQLNTKAVFIDIISDNKKAAPLHLDINTIYYAQSNNNYTTLFYQTKEGIKKKLIRVTLKNIDEQVSVHKQFIRCHRSYLINKKHIVNVEGNARSLTVSLRDIDKKIPVSRNFPREALTTN